MERCFLSLSSSHFLCSFDGGNKPTSSSDLIAFLLEESETPLPSAIARSGGRRPAERRKRVPDPLRITHVVL